MKKIRRGIMRIIKLTVGDIAERIILFLRYWRLIDFDIFYSQYGEDIIIRSLFRGKRMGHCSYLDIGANNPKVINNTYLMYKNGSRGILVEPDTEMCRRLKSIRKGDVVLNCGVAEQPGILTYYVMNNNTLNTFSEESAKRCVEYGSKIIDKKKVRVVTINQIMEKYGKVDFLSIDVEGKDFEILKTLDFDRFTPFVICLETQEFCGTKRRDFEKISQFLSKKDYMIYADTMLNTIYVKKQEYLQMIQDLKLRIDRK